MNQKYKIVREKVAYVIIFLYLCNVKQIMFVRKDTYVRR